MIEQRGTTHPEMDPTNALGAFGDGSFRTTEKCENVAYLDASHTQEGLPRPLLTCTGGFNI